VGYIIIVNAAPPCLYQRAVIAIVLFIGRYIRARSRVDFSLDGRVLSLSPSHHLRSTPFFAPSRIKCRWYYLQSK